MSNSTLCIFSDKSPRGSLFNGQEFESHSGLGFFQHLCSFVPLRG